MRHATPMDDAISHFKGILHGKQGSGKTHTAVLLACEIHKRFKCKKPVVCIDTERGLRFHRTRIHEATGQVPLYVQTRKFDVLMETLQDAVAEGYEVVLIDSVTHFWQGLQEGYKAALADRFHKKPSQVKLNLNDIGVIKDTWAPFNRWVVEANIHTIICGRLGYEWDYVEDERGESKLTKVGTKTKAETEFGHEPDFVMEMEHLQHEHPEVIDAIKDRKLPENVEFVVRGTVTKDRWDILMGKRVFNPTGEFFMPYISRLRPRDEVPVDADPGVLDLGEDARHSYRVEKSCVLENIEMALVRAFPSTGKADRTGKLDVIEAAFETLSWEEIRRRSLADLKVLMPLVKQVCDWHRVDPAKLPQHIKWLVDQRDELLTSKKEPADAGQPITPEDIDEAFGGSESAALGEPVGEVGGGG